MVNFFEKYVKFYILHRLKITVIKGNFNAQKEILLSFSGKTEMNLDDLLLDTTKPLTGRSFLIPQW